MNYKDKAEVSANYLEKVQESLKYINDVAENAGIGYDELMWAAYNNWKNDDYLIDGGRWEGYGVGDKFWEHYTTVTGINVPARRRGSIFSCAC